MKKIFSFLVILAICFCGCNKDDEESESTKVINASKMALVVDFSTLDDQVLNVVDITILGTDFEGQEINCPVTKSGEYRWEKANPTFVDGEYLNPITIEIKIVAKENPVLSDVYTGTMTYMIKCEAYEEGNSNNCICTRTMDTERLLLNHSEGESNIDDYLSILTKMSLKSSTYTFDFGATKDGNPNFGWNTKYN